MSYSFEDFFAEYVTPEMIKLFTAGSKKPIDENEPDLSEKFLEILRRAIQMHNRGDGLSRRLLEVATNEDGAEVAPDEFLKQCFNKRYEYELGLRKVEYDNHGSIISVNYNGEMDEEELREKIAEKIADKTDFVDHRKD